MKNEFDSIVKSIATAINDHEIQLAAAEVMRQLAERPWNRHQPIMMIAFEDQH